MLYITRVRKVLLSCGKFQYDMTRGAALCYSASGTGVLWRVPL